MLFFPSSSKINELLSKFTQFMFPCSPRWQLLLRAAVHLPAFVIGVTQLPGRPVSTPPPTQTRCIVHSTLAPRGRPEGPESSPSRVPSTTCMRYVAPCAQDSTRDTPSRCRQHPLPSRFAPSTIATMNTFTAPTASPAHHALNLGSRIHPPTRHPQNSCSSILSISSRHSAHCAPASRSKPANHQQQS